MPTSEALARENIDRQLTACGWIVQSRAEMNLYAGRGIAVREFPLDGGSSTMLRADYLLFVEENRPHSSKGLQRSWGKKSSNQLINVFFVINFAYDVFHRPCPP
jgi:hypothetical protein